MNSRIISIINFTFILAVAFMVGCKNSDDLDKNGYPKVFKIALAISNEDIPEEAFRRMEPMRLYLERELKIPVRYLRVTTYAPVIEAFKSKKIHMASLSPYPYLLARQKAKVSAIFCLGKKNGNQTGEYKTAIVTQKSSGLKTLDDIKAKSRQLTIVFVDPASTSGHIVPNNYLLHQGINPDKDFKKVVFANSALASILTLYSGKVDVACAQITAFNRVYKMNHKISDNDFNFIWISEPIPPTSYCIRDDINPIFKQKVIEAYLNVKKDTAAWAAINKTRQVNSGSSLPMDSLGFVQVNDRMYDGFETMVKNTKGLKIEK